jgi:hypothetical protein
MISYYGRQTKKVKGSLVLKFDFMFILFDCICIIVKDLSYSVKSYLVFLLNKSTNPLNPNKLPTLGSGIA